MATALAPEKPPLGQKTPWAGSRLENRPLSRRMHREKCRSLVRPASGAPVFANGAATAAMAYAFNQAITSEERRNKARELLLGEDETIDILTPSLMRKRLGLLGESFLDRANAVGEMSAEEFASYMNRTYPSSEEDLWGGYRDQHSVVLRRHGYALSSGSLSRRLDALVVSAAEFGLTNIAGGVLRKSGAGLVSSVSPNSPQDPILRSSTNRTPILRSVDMNVYEIDWR